VLKRETILPLASILPLLNDAKPVFQSYQPINMASRRPPTTQAELIFLPNLRNCLLNLPSSLVAVLLNSNTIAQNVVVELSYRVPAPHNTQDPKQKLPGISKSVFLGWTGMQSQSKQTAIVGRDGIAASARGEGAGKREVDTVEVDATFGRLLGLGEGLKVM
jgi:peroxin-1